MLLNNEDTPLMTQSKVEIPGRACRAIGSVRGRLADGVKAVDVSSSGGEISSSLCRFSGIANAEERTKCHKGQARAMPDFFTRECINSRESMYSRLLMESCKSMHAVHRSPPDVRGESVYVTEFKVEGGDGINLHGL